MAGQLPRGHLDRRTHVLVKRCAALLETQDGVDAAELHRSEKKYEEETHFYEGLLQFVNNDRKCVGSGRLNSKEILDGMKQTF